MLAFDNRTKLRIMLLSKNIFMLLSLSFLSLACDKSGLYDRKNKQKYEGAIINFKNVTTLYSENAKLKIKIIAPKQEVFQNSDVIYPQGVSISMYNAAGIKTTDLQADTGRYDYAQQLYKGIGHVIVTNVEQQQTLYTDELMWSQGRHEIFTEDTIKIVTRNETLNGIGLVSNEEFSKYTIKKPTGVFSLEDRKKQDSLATIQQKNPYSK
jgi:LPS export ABC transporter protein LptC